MEDQEGSPRDLTRARALLYCAVERNHPKAILVLALQLYTGVGHEAAEKALAVDLLQDAAQKGVAGAADMLTRFSQTEATAAGCVALGLDRVPVAIPDVVKKARHVVVRHAGSTNPDFAARLLVCTVDAGLVLRVVDFDWQPKVVALESAADFSLAVVTADATVFFRNYRLRIFSKLTDVPLSQFMCKTNVVSKSTGRLRTCRGCGSETAHGLSKCLHCHHNWHDSWMAAASFVPLLGLPVTAARATLRERQRAIDCDNEGTGTAVGMSVAGVTLAHAALGSLLGGVVSAVHSASVKSRGSGNRDRPSHGYTPDGPVLLCSSHLRSKGSDNLLLWQAMPCRCKGCERHVPGGTCA